MFGHDLFPEQLDEDAPSGPRIGNLPSIQGTLINFEQLFNDILHPKEIEFSTSVGLDDPRYDFLIDQQQTICIFAALADLPVEKHHLLQILLRVIFISYVLNKRLKVYDIFL